MPLFILAPQRNFVFSHYGPLRHIFWFRPYELDQILHTRREIHITSSLILRLKCKMHACTESALCLSAFSHSIDRSTKLLEEETLINWTH